MLIPANTTGRAAEAAARSQEAVMGKAIPQQHPAVVLRSHYAHLRALLVIAMIAVVGLTVAVVIVANDRDDANSTSALKPAESVNSGGVTAEHPLQSRIDSPRYDGGPEEGTAASNIAQPPVTRYDGGPEDGTAALNTAQPPVTRYDGGPEEGTQGIVAPSRGSVAQAESPTRPGFNTD